MAMFSSSIAGENKFLSTHQHEIHFMKVALQKTVVAAYQVVEDIIRPSQPSRGGAEDSVRRDLIEGAGPDDDRH